MKIDELKVCTKNKDKPSLFCKVSCIRILNLSSIKLRVRYEKVAIGMKIMYCKFGISPLEWKYEEFVLTYINLLI